MHNRPVIVGIGVSVILLVLCFAFSCYEDQDAEFAQASADVEVQPMVSTLGEDLSSDETISPAQTMGLFDLPAGAITIPADQIERARMEAQATEQAFGNKRLLSAVNIDLPELSQGAWERIESPWGEVSYRMAIYGEGATSMRPHFSAMPQDGLEVLVYGDDPEQFAIIAEPTRTARTADFWGPTIAGSVVFIEVIPGEDESFDLPVDMVSVGIGSDSGEKLGTCYLDPSCYSAWSSMKSGVVWISFVEPAGTYICSAELLNDVNASGKPWLLTANHCLSTQSVADTIEVVWNYQTSTCNGAVPNFSTLPRTFGSDMKCTSSKSDYTLLLLDANPPSGVTYLGWSTASLKNGASITTIHHPGGSWKRISFGKVTATGGNFWKVKYSQSSTEGGSSGAPLFNSNKQVVGQLYGGTALCTNMKGYDLFGKFGVSYNNCMKNFIGQ